MSDNELHNWQAIFGTTIRLKVTPKASSNRLKLEYDADQQLLLRVYVTAVPENGKANAAVLKLLAKKMGIAPSRLIITHGQNDRYKRIEII